MMKLASSTLLFFGLSIVNAAAAMTLTTSYLSLDLPDDWSCRKQNIDWICQPSSPSESKSAALVISAKLNRPEETLSAIESALQKPQVVSSKSRGAVTSQQIWLKKVRLQNEDWIESLHANREVEDFYTYYLTTVHRGLGILLNLSYEKSHAKNYENLLAQLRNSVRFNELSAENLDSNAAPTPTASSTPAPATEAVNSKPASGTESKGLPAQIIFIIGAALLFAGAIFLLKK